MSDKNSHADEKQSSHSKEGTYDKLGNAGTKGNHFQVNLLITVLLNGSKKNENWRLSTENKAAGIFDDVVIELLPSLTAVLIQAKHKETKNINYEDLISDSPKNDFSLPKYFLSYQKIKYMFAIRNVIICTNTNIAKKVKTVVEEQCLSTESPLYLEGQNIIYYTFKESFLPEVKQSFRRYCIKNLGDKKVNASDDSIKSFLNHLQLVVNYPTGGTLSRSFENLIHQIEFAQGLERKTCREHIYTKIDAWYIQPKGTYLTQVKSKAFFCEIRSNMYSDMLKTYNISFKSSELPLKDLNKGMLLIYPEQEYIMSVIKLHQALQNEDMSKVLFLSLDEKIDVQKQFIDAFEVPHYTYLIIICPKIADNVNREMHKKLADILSSTHYKKVILIAGEGNKLVKEIKDVNIHFSELKEKIGFSSLAEDSQKNYREMKCITFQGNDISLDELLPTLSNEELNDVINPETLVKFATRKKINVGLEMNQLDENIKCYYIQRKFNRGCQNIPEETLYHFYKSNEENIVLISDAPGMGKSSVLTNLAASLKKNSPNLWIIRVDINNYSDALLGFQKKNLKSVTIEELLNSEEKTRLSSDLEKKVFSLPKKVVLMIDGIDEVSPTYKDVVLNLLMDCKERPNFALIFITTRPHLCKELEQKLQVRSWTMELFSRIDQIVFLKKYWLKNLNLKENLKEKCEVYAQTLITKTSRWFKHTFTGIPLQARMLAEVFQEEGNNLEEWETCNEFLMSTDGKPKLPNKFDVVKLYDMFIGKKYDGFINYYSKKLSNYGKIYKECMRYHHSSALKTILSEENCKLFDCHKVEDRKNIDEEFPLKLGIIQKVDGRIHFIHRTVAEYFVAKCLMKQLKRGINSEQFYNFFVNKVLISDQFSTIRLFLNSFLQTEADVLPYNIYDDTAKQLTLLKNKLVILKCAEEGSVEILRLLFRCCHAANIDVSVNINSVIIEPTCTLHKATVGGNLDMICLLIEKGCRINDRDEGGRTSLYPAVMSRNLDIVKYLVENGIEINNRDNDGRTALYIACAINELGIVKYLVENGANINIRTKYGCTALYKSAAYGDVVTLKYLIQKGAEVNIRRNDGRTPLHEASKLGRWFIVKCLVENGADVGIKSEHGITALHETAAKGRHDVVKYLVMYGAQVNCTTEDGTTALHVTSELNTIKYLIKNGADVNSKNKDGYTVLYKAAARGELDAVKCLLEYGAVINNRAEDGRTALHEAALWGHIDIVKFLVENGAHADNRQLDGRTLDLVKYLAENGAQVNNNNRVKDNHSAIHAAATSGSLDTVNCLLKCGAEVDSKDIYGRTALHEAAARSNLEVIKYLVHKGSDINSRTKNGRTALHEAAMSGDLGTVRYLVENGASVNIKDKDGYTALHMAPARCYSDVVRYLTEKGAEQ